MIEYKQRRAHPRINCTVPIVILTETSELLHSALMLNYSEGGMYFEISAPIDTGSYITIKTDSESPIDPIGSGTWDKRQAEVRWCREFREEGSARYGCGVQYTA